MSLPIKQDVQHREEKLINILSNKDEATWSAKGRIKNIHTLFRYPAVMVPDMLEDLLKIFFDSNPDIENIIDPFMGSGTSLVTSMKFGKNCYGQDINPLAVLVSKVKTGPFFTAALDEKIPFLYSIISQDRDLTIEIDYTRYDHWFTKQVAIKLSKIHRAIKKERNIHVRRFFWVSLAETVRLSSNDRTSTYKLHRRSKEELDSRNVDPIEKFKDILEDNLEDLKGFKATLKDENLLSRNGYYSKDLKIHLEDSKTKIHPHKKNQFYDLLVTSPPYGDNKTTVPYGQHSHLPLLWIDFSDIDPKADTSFLRTQSEIDNRSIGGKRNGDLEKVKEKLIDSSPTLATIFAKLEPKADNLTEKVAYFYNDLFLSIDNAIDSLKENGYMIWVVGNRRVGNIEIHTDRILTDYLISKGARAVQDLNRVIHHKRMPSRNSISQTMSQEKILIFRKTV